MSNTLVLDRDEVRQVIEEMYRGGSRYTILLNGPPGTGKSTLAQDIAATLNLPYYPYGSHPDASNQDLIRGMEPGEGANGKADWTVTYGPVLASWGHHPDTNVKPGVLIMDDVHLMGPGGQSAMYKACDVGAGASIYRPSDGKVLKPDPTSFTILTMNGDPRELPEPVVDRCLKIPVMTPSTPMLDALNPEIRELCEADYDGRNANPIATYREWRHMSELWPMIGLAKAVIISLGDSTRAQAMLEVMSVAGITGAAAALQAVLASMRSGAPHP